MKKLVSLVLLLALCALASLSLASSDVITNVEVFTFVPSAGQMLKSIEVTVSDPAILEGVTADDFSLSGMSGMWGTEDLHPFSVNTSAVSVDGNKLTITFSGFTEKYLYVNSWTCSSRIAALNFTMDDVTATHTEVADEFEQVRMFDAEGNATGATFDYNLFTPEDTSVPQPLVLALHGSGDYLNLLQNRVVISWAEPQNQADRPCYVLAPLVQETSLTNEQALKASYDFIKQMIEEGKVDGDRVYVMGKSRGGRNTYFMLTRYYDIFAGGMILVGGTEPETDVPLTAEEKSNIGKVPVYNIYSELDDAAKSGRSSAITKEIVDNGYMDQCMERVYAVREMDNRGVGGTHHDVEIICMEDVNFMEWLFAQSK